MFTAPLSEVRHAFGDSREKQSALIALPVLAGWASTQQVVFRR
jgi:hypothetical protein